MPYTCLLQEGYINLPRQVEKARESNYTVIAGPISFEVPLEFQTDLSEHQNDNTYSDLLMTCEQWNSKFIACLSDHIDCESVDENVRKNSEQILAGEVDWAAYLQAAGYTMIRLTSGVNTNLVRILTKRIKGVILVQVPLFNIKVAQSVWRNDITENQLEQINQEECSWHWWNRFRLSANFHPKVKVVLELNGSDLPSSDVVRRWLGEPLEAVIIPSSLFILNRANHPVLPKVWQEVLARFLLVHVNFIVSAGLGDNAIKLYADYLSNFREMNKDVHQLQSFEDVLEIPLQPLYDDLDAYTYEMFEKDPVKYKLYQKAIEAALTDCVTEEEIGIKKVVIMVLGAGRGPLVRAALNASEKTKRGVRIYIIEKNTNAIRTLTALVKKLWANKDIRIFSKDMRVFTPPEKADILVSELLGSFGDNELSPECLDCAQKLLKEDGISIPCKSTSYINPIMSSKLYNAVRQIPREQFRDKQPAYLANAESGYVVMLKNIFNIGFPQALFEFTHPSRVTKNDRPIDNSRFKVLQFEVTMDCILNGIAGYFDTVLYKDIILSINPMTHTMGMNSWFPMYFPFTEPRELKKGQTIEIKFWRCVTRRKIWYEWCLTSPFTTHIHNKDGQAYKIFCT